MVLEVLLFAVGALLAAMTLRDVFDTVIVPGGSRASLRIAKRLVFILLPLWKAVRGRRRGLSSAFAPFVLVMCFVLWMALLAIGFGLMAFAYRHHFRPALESVPEAVYMVGSAIVTIGLSGETARGAARWIVLAGGFCGLAVMTMAVTYLLEVQNSIARRDTGIIKLNTSAGEPPSALTLLERFAAIGNQAELADVLREGRDWCATVRQSHANHPSLIYFQSVGTGAGWPAALGALLDLALIFELLIDDEQLRGPAILLGQEGTRMALELANLINLKLKPPATDEADLRAIEQRLASCCYALRAALDPAAIAARRDTHQSAVAAIAQHLGKPATVLLPAA